MAATQLRRNIRLIVGGNHLSPPPFSPFSAARPSMGARSCSSFSMPSSPRQAQKILQWLRTPFYIGVVYMCSDWFDFEMLRREHELLKTMQKSDIENLVLADLATIKREIAIKMESAQRAHKNDNIPQAVQHAKSGD